MKILIVIPVYNEELTIGSVVALTKIRRGEIMKAVTINSKVYKNTKGCDY